jgi:hypothetical protein
LVSVSGVGPQTFRRWFHSRWSITIWMSVGWVACQG